MFAVHLLEAKDEEPPVAAIIETRFASVMFAGAAIEISMGHFGGGVPVIQLADPRGNRLVFTSTGLKASSK